MKNEYNLISCWLVLLFLLSACANIVSPVGGDKDTEPPQIDSLASTENFQTQFDKKVIILRFNEWIRLKDQQNQIVFSPPLTYKTDVELKGKDVIIAFDPDEVFRENTTYTINFGSAIEDITEGNSLENYKFVFSTGDIIDSLQISGKVIDAVSLEPAEGVTVMLYDVFEDSIVYKENPFYFAKTGEKGFFTISNVREDEFKIVALKDANFNYKFDLQEEKIGFSDTSINLVESIKGLSLKVFQNEMDLQYMDYNYWSPNYLSIKYNQSAPDILVNSNAQIDYVEAKDDSLMIWLSPSTDSIQEIILSHEENYRDTISISKPRSAKVGNFEITEVEVSNFIKHTPSKNLKLGFNYPIKNINEALIELIDTAGTTDFEIIRDTINDRLIYIKSPWKEAIRYKLHFLPGALSSDYHNQSDTLKVTFPVGSSNEFSTLHINASRLDADVQYLVQLEKGQKILSTDIIKNKKLGSLSYYNIAPEKYVLRVIEDRNLDGRWTTGNYLKKQAAEKQRIFKIEDLRANWEKELTVIWNE